MENSDTKEETNEPRQRRGGRSVAIANNTIGMGNPVYCLGFIGAVIHYVSIAGSFWAGVLGVLKALVWPAFLVYEVLKTLHL